MNSGWRVLIVAISLCLGLSSEVWAQGGGSGAPRQGGPPRSGGPPQALGFKWWQDAKFKTDLGLTADQCKRMEDVYQGVRPRMTSDKEGLDQLEKQLSEVISAGVLPEADVVKLIDQVETARAQLGKVRTLMIYRLRQLLTPDQRIKMRALHEAWEKERRQGPVRKGPQGMPREGGLL